tara:strand:- start:703 stop:4428 length:3726 start_codon:yes stop_codon:yes gene_type:complete
MPKLTVNLNDFSGGINTSKNARDIEVNEAQDLDGLTNYEIGSLQLRGGFVRPNGFVSALGGYNTETVNEGIPNLYGVRPEYSFRIVDSATVSVSSDTATFTIVPSSSQSTNGAHGLDTGNRIVIFDQSSGTDYIGKYFDITVVDSTSFTATGATGLTTGLTLNYALNVEYDSRPSELDQLVFGNLANLKHKESSSENQYLMKAHAKVSFGFYSVGTIKSWYGSNKIERNFGYKYPWLFDNKYTFDVIQDRGVSLAASPIYDIIYEKGMLKTLSSFNGEFKKGLCRRPVNYMYIPKRMHFAGFPGNECNYNIAPGWYNLRSHILCPQEYIDPVTQENFTNGGTLELDYDATTAITASLTDPTNANQVAIAIGTGDNVGDGDWQFSTGDHRKLGLGVSFLYDDTSIAFGQESGISKLGDGAITMTDCEDDKSLWVFIKLFRGETLSADSELDALYKTNSAGPNVAIPEQRMYEGASNEHKSWSPRVVGINLYLTEDFNGEYESPLLLATFPFDSKTEPFSHDNKKGLSQWSTTPALALEGLCVNKIENIQTVPTIPYNLKNGYEHTDQISAWYKTAAVVNRRLYAGNITQFKHKVQESENTYNATKYPDRILKSDYEKFDVLPQNNWVDVMPQDGQSIIKLVSHNNELLIFKNSDLYVLDCSGEIDILSKKFISKGVESPAYVTQNSEYVFWCNKNSVYGYKDGEVIDLLIKQNTDFWAKRITPGMHPVFDPSSNQLIVFSKRDDDNAYDKRCIIIDINTGSLTVKSDPTESKTFIHSGGVIMDNKLYITGKIPGFGGGNDHDDHQDEEARTEVLTTHNKGNTFKAIVSFKVGTGDSAAASNVLSNNVKFLYVRRGSSWVQANISSKTFNTTITSGDEAQRGEYLAKDLNSNLSPSLGTKISFQYDEATEIVTGNIIGKTHGVGQNPSLESKTGYGSTGLFFASTQSSSNFNIGNITDFNYKVIELGVASSAGSFRITATRKGYTEKGTEYKMTIYLSDSKSGDSNQYKSYTSTYVTGEHSNYLKDNDYLDDTAGINDNAINDNLIHNLKEYFTHNYFNDITGDKQYKGKDLMSFSDIGGSTGSKYFDMTVVIPEDWDDVIVDTETSSANGSELYVYDNETTSIPVTVGHCKYATPDIDFGEPNVRKKVYKAYVTYKDSGAYGRVSVYYQVNQSGTWTLATTPGTTTTGYLDENKTSFYRQEITFGTDANSAFSIALKFENQEPIKEFTINDITLIYRPKNPK